MGGAWDEDIRRAIEAMNRQTASLWAFAEASWPVFEYAHSGSRLASIA